MPPSGSPGFDKLSQRARADRLSGGRQLRFIYLLGPMYIDIHSHFLHGVDDGPDTIETSIKMLRRAVMSGIRAVAATPHIIDNLSPGWEETVLLRFREIARAVIEEQIEIDVYLGSEIYFQFNLPELVEWSIGSYRGMGAYSLIETSLSQYPRHFEQTLDILLARGKHPIFAHPERVSSLLGDSGRIAALVEKGILIQVSAGSLLGDFGRKIESFTWELLERGVVHCVASDAHDLFERPFNLDTAWNAVTARCGEDTAGLLMYSNPRHILFGEEVEPVPGK
jgi:protein-tyrosine phosphatase